MLFIKPIFIRCCNNKSVTYVCIENLYVCKKKFDYALIASAFVSLLIKVIR